MSKTGQLAGLLPNLTDCSLTSHFGEVREQSCGVRSTTPSQATEEVR